MNDSIEFWSASEQLRAFRAGTVSPVEVLEAQQARDERFGSAINAFSERMYEEALDAALFAERRYAGADSEEDLPPLLGVTVAVKASHDMAGHTIENGVRSERANLLADHDHPVVELLRKAGAVLHARTTTPEFNCATVTHSSQWGVTRNPWNLSLSPGGSSGGSAAAIAAGMSTLATASDIAGSIRIPATFSGLIGYKPPWGWTPGAGPMSRDRYLVQGGLARTVDDSVLLLAAMSDPRLQACAIPVPPRGHGKAEGPLRIAVSRNLRGYLVDADVSRNLLRTAEQLELAGHIVEHVDVDVDPEVVHAASFAHLGHIFLPAKNLSADPAAALAAYTRAFIAEAQRYAAQFSWHDTLVMEHRVQQAILSVYEEHDVLLCPVSGISSLPADGDFVDDVEVAEGVTGHYWRRHLALPFNIVDTLASISVPNGFGDLGVPTSVQVVAPPGALLVDLARQIERMNPIGTPVLV